MKTFVMPKSLVSLAKKRPPFQINTAGNWLILNDLHIPHQDDETVEKALSEAHKRGVAGILLNGDILDSAEISTHMPHRDRESYKNEILMAREFLSEVRKHFPKARIVYKSGNHEDRLDRYVIKNAEALDGLDGVNLPAFLEMEKRSIEWVQDKRTVRLGKLNVFHGHEFNGGGGTNVARWLMLKTGGGTVACCGHFHKTDMAGGRNVDGYQCATWGIGCACDLYPQWCFQNQWNHGYAIVELASDGNFIFHNQRVVKSSVY